MTPEQQTQLKALLTQAEEQNNGGNYAESERLANEVVSALRPSFL